MISYDMTKAWDRKICADVGYMPPGDILLLNLCIFMLLHNFRAIYLVNLTDQRVKLWPHAVLTWSPVVHVYHNKKSK